MEQIGQLKILGSIRNGTAGLKKAQAEKPDIILLDIMLPGTNGLKIMEMLNSTPWRPYIIVLTNYSNLYFKQRCMGLGAKAFYDKSVQFEEAVAKINTICNGSA